MFAVYVRDGPRAPLLADLLSSGGWIFPQRKHKCNSLTIDINFIQISIRYRGPSVPASGTLDRAAMIRGDTSSEGSGNDNFAAVRLIDFVLMQIVLL